MLQAWAYGLKPIHIENIKQQRCDLYFSSGAWKPFSLAIYHMKIQSGAVAPINVPLAGM